MPEFLGVEQEGRILIFTVRRPNVMNSLHAPACRELSAVLDRFHGNRRLGCVTPKSRRKR